MGPLHEAPAGEVLLVNKPKGWTSFDVVNKIRHAARIRKVGHAGTLDPLATGLLVVCTAGKTREIASFVGLDKSYRVTMKLGERTASYDADSPVIETRSVEGVTVGQVRGVLEAFVGEQRQIPPMWSAVKVQGRRLYEYARKGVEVARRERTVRITSITLLDALLPEVRFDVTCSKGTYVRTLVEDIGLAIGCGAHVAALERTRVGAFRLEDAWAMEDLVQALVLRREQAV